MHSWFQKLWKSRLSSSGQIEKDTKGTPKSLTFGTTVPTSPYSTSPLNSLSSPLPLRGKAPSRPQPQCALQSEQRWKRKYDVFVCHSSAQKDIEEATRLVSFLEASPCSLRCFLWQRDTCPGGAICTEFCQAVQNSHLRALLITPNFVKDDWCNYMMHQTLAEGPMSNSMIPLIHDLSDPSQYPRELKFYYYIDLSKNPDQGYTLLNKTVLRYLEDLVKKELILNSNMNVSTSGLDGEGSPQK